MDKQEYKILSEEIMTLVANEQFAEAVEIADRIDWRKVRSFTMLQRISDLYKINRRYDEALEILFLAYDKNPNSKTIVYGICELYLDLGDFITALQYMSVYNKMAPKDVGGVILKYKVLEMEEASYEDRVELLEKICDMSYQAEWAYQLAYMYHRMGLGTKCVEVCDQLISWFGSGAFVIKAMELKMLHEKLTSYQQEVYDHRNDVEDDLRAYEGDEEVPGTVGEEDFHVKTIDMSKFNTINLQKVLAESMRDLMGEEGNTQDLSTTGKITQDLVQPLVDEQQYAEENYEENYEDNYSEGYDNYEENYSEGEYPEEYEGEYSEGEYPEDEQYYSNEQYAEPEPEYSEPVSQTHTEPYSEPYSEPYVEKSYASQPTLDNSYASQPKNVDYVAPDETAYMPASEALAGSGETFFDDKTGDIVIDQVPLNMLNNLIPGVEFVTTERTTAPLNSEVINNAVAKPVGNTSGSSFASKYGTGQSQVPQNATPSKINRIENTSKSKAFASQLAYESDGQISLVVPDRMPIERQITGQMNIVDVLAEWEHLKKRKEAQQNEVVRQNIMEKTGRIFLDYEESKSDTIIAHIEQNKKKLDRVLPSKTFDATEALNKTYGPNIWDEVDRAIEADKARVGGAGAAVAGAAGVAAVAGAAGVAVGAGIAAAGKSAEAGAVKAAGDVAEAVVDGVAEVAGDVAGIAVNSSVPDTKKAGIEQKKAIEKETKPDSLRLVESEEEISDKTAANKVKPEEAIPENEANQTEVAEEIGYEDEDGNFVVGDYDEDGNFMEYGYYDKDGNYFEYTGYYDEDGNYIEYEVVSSEATVNDADIDSDNSATETTDENTEAEKTVDEAIEAEVDNEDSSDKDVIEENADEASSEEVTAEEASSDETVETEAVETEAAETESIDTELAEAEAEAVTDETIDETAAEAELNEAVDEAEAADAEVTEEGYEYSENMDTAEINDLGSVLEQAADETSAETLEDINDEYTVTDEERDFSSDEQVIFADYLYSKKMRGQILEAIDIISLASYVGNVLITGDAGANVLGLAKSIIKEIQLIDGNFSSGRVAKISGNKMNQKDIPGMLMQLANGALIIEKASKMSRSTLENLTMALENANDGIIIILTDTKIDMDKLINNYGVITGYFNARIDIIPMSINALVEYAKKYAYSQEYKIDEETGVLALHERISDLQIGEHHVSIAEVEEIIDEAIDSSKRPRISTFIDILTAKRYDYEDMIILKEKDFRG